MIGTLGLIETIGLVSAIEAADAALKAANVHLIGLTKVGSGIVTIQLSGDVGAVTAAVEAGGMAAEHMGNLRATHVIPRLAGSINTILAKKEQPKKTSLEPVEKSLPLTNETKEIKQLPELDEIQKMSNKQLREKIQSLGIAESQAQLSTMRKDELIEMLTKYYSEGGR